MRLSRAVIDDSEDDTDYYYVYESVLRLEPGQMFNVPLETETRFPYR